MDEHSRLTATDMLWLQKNRPELWADIMEELAMREDDRSTPDSCLLWVEGLARAGTIPYYAHFDLSALPEGTIITSVRLELETWQEPLWQRTWYWIQLLPARLLRGIVAALRI